VDIYRVEFDPAASPAVPLGRNELSPSRGTVDDDVAAVSEVQRRVLENRRRLDGRVVLEAAASVGTKRGGAGIGPDIRAPAPALAKLDVVDVRGRSRS